jgi:hypothetical protein
MPDHLFDHLAPHRDAYHEQLGPMPALPVFRPARRAPRLPARDAAERRERLRHMRYWLLDGIAPAHALRLAKSTWAADAATARAYLRHVRRRWASAAGGADHLAALWAAKLQREHLIQALAAKLAEKWADKEAAPRDQLALLTPYRQLLRERDQLLDRIHRHRIRCRRDTSPDRRARAGPGALLLPAAELRTRLEHLRNVLRLEWERGEGREAVASGEHRAPDGLDKETRRRGAR